MKTTSNLVRRESRLHCGFRLEDLDRNARAKIALDLLLDELGPSGPVRVIEMLREEDFDHSGAAERLGLARSSIRTAVYRFTSLAKAKLASDPSLARLLKETLFPVDE